MEIRAESVKELRDKTGAGFMDCKKALAEAQGDLEQAVRWLREKGLAAAAKKAGRVTSEGLIGTYLHAGGRIGVLVEVNCETDFVAKTPDFQTLVKELAMQVAAASPSYASRAEVPADLLEKEKAIYRAQMEGSGKPANVLEKIIEGKLGSYYKQTVLTDQDSIRDTTGKTSVKDVLAAANKALGASVSVTRFARLKVGEAAQ